MTAKPAVLRPAAVLDVEDATDHLDVWRVLHGKKDIPAWLTEQDKAS